MKKKILIVDDTMYMRALVKDAIKGEEYEIVGEAANGEEAIDLAYSLKPDLITLDNVLPDMMGLDVLKILTESDLDCKILMVSAVGQEAVKAKGLELGAIGYIVKPFQASQLAEVVSAAFDQNSLLSKAG